MNFRQKTYSILEEGGAYLSIEHCNKGCHTCLTPVTNGSEKRPWPSAQPEIVPRPAVRSCKPTDFNLIMLVDEIKDFERLSAMTKTGPGIAT